MRQQGTLVSEKLHPGGTFRPVKARITSWLKAPKAQLSACFIVLFVSFLYLKAVQNDRAQNLGLRGFWLAIEYHRRGWPALLAVKTFVSFFRPAWAGYWSPFANSMSVYILVSRSQHQLFHRTGWTQPLKNKNGHQHKCYQYYQPPDLWKVLQEVPQDQDCTMYPT
jgi:hypothetical protein